MSHSSNRILYIEDNPSIIDGLSHFFNDKGFVPKFVNDCDEFTNILKDYDPQIVILDDDIKGKKYYYQVFVDVDTRRKRDKKKIVLIGCTSQPDWKAIKKDYLQQGFDAFFENDGSPEALEIIYTYIEQAIMKNKI